MRGISPRAQNYVRSRAVENMTATCVIERVGAQTFDEDTSTLTSGSRVVIYTGLCRIWEVTAGQVVPVGEVDEVVLQSTRLSLPWDTSPVPKRDDEVWIQTSPADSALVGKRFRILSAAMGGDLRATRQFVVQGIQER